MKSAGELQHLAEVHHWQPGPRTFAEIQRIIPDQTAWEEISKKTKFKKELAEPATKAKSAREAESAKAARIHSEQHSKEEFSAGTEEVRKFLVAYPQFVRSQSNLEALS